MRIVSTALLIGALFSLSFSAGWEQTAGPDGSLVKKFVTNGVTGHIFAGTTTGVYRSNDGGGTWQWVTASLGAKFDVDALTSLGSKTFVSATGTTDEGLYYSSDYGGNWVRAAGNGLPLYTLFPSLAITPARLIAGISSLLGTTGIYYSTNNGENWTAGTGLPSGFVPGQLLVVGTNIFAGASINATTKGMYLSTDEGSTWTGINTNFPTTAGVTGLASIGSTVFSGTLTSGVFMTTNNGAQWTKINPTTALGFSSTLAATNSNLYIGVGGIYKADASGNNWDSVNTGFPARNAGTSINAITVSGSNILASFYNLGVYRSTDNGGSWSPSNSGLRNSKVNGIKFSGSTLFAASNTTGYFRSTDEGNSWQEINSGVAISTNNGFYGFTPSGSNFLAGSGGYGVVRTTDNGNSWLTDVTGLGAAPAYCIIVDGSETYASTLGDVARSNDNGVSWTYLNSGFPSYIAVMTILKYQSVIIAGGSAGYKRTTDGGSTWTAPISGLPGTPGFSASLRIDSIFFFAHSAGVYRSTNRGETWSAVWSGIPLGVGPLSLYTDGTKIWAGTNNGVYVTSNQGTSWTAINAGFPNNISIRSLDMNNNYLFAGTDGYGVWRRPVSEITGVRTNIGEIPKSFSLEQNYPNPFNPGTVIEYQLPVMSRVSLKIFNLIGEEIKSFTESEQSAGIKRISWTGSDFPSGIYFYRLDATSISDPSKHFSQTRKMILIK